MISTATFKRKMICSVLILLSFISNGQSITLNQGTIIQNEYYAEIPFEYVNSKIIIPVVIQDKTYRFLLDTGAPNCITLKLKNSLNTKVIQQISVTDANNNKSIMDVVALPELSIGGIVFQNAVALAYADDKNIIYDCFAIDGFIGSNLLRNSILQIDTKNKVIRITDDLAKVMVNEKQNSKLTLIGNQSSPFIWIQLNGKKSAKEQVLIDTGMAGFYDLSNRVYSIFKDKTEIKLVSTGTGSNSLGMFENSKNDDLYRVRIPELTITEAKFTSITTTTTSDKNSRIGMGFLEYGIGTLDFKNKKFYYSAYNATTDLHETLLPFSPTLSNNKLTIGVVWDANLKSKISTGDEIIEINGINYEQYAICDLITKPSVFKNITIKEVVVKKIGGAIVKVSL
jgi:predicted aspartyl protease